MNNIEYKIHNVPKRSKKNKKYTIVYIVTCYTYLSKKVGRYLFKKTRIYIFNNRLPTCIIIRKRIIFFFSIYYLEK